MNIELHDYDLYPKVFPVGREVELTLRPLGKQSAFSGR